MRNTNFSIVAVALTAMLINADLTQAQSIVTYESSAPVVWIEHQQPVIYSSQFDSMPFVETEVFYPVVNEVSTNPIIEVSPQEYFSTAVQPTKPAKTVASPVVHSKKVQPAKPAKFATPVVHSKTVQPEPQIQAPQAATITIPAPHVTPIIEPTYHQPATGFYQTATPVCMSGG